MKAADIMAKRVVSVSPDARLDDAMREMDRIDARHLPVVAGKRLVGILSDRELLEATGWLAPREREVLEAPDGPVAAFMTKDPLTAKPSDPIGVLAERMATQRVGCLPVVEGDELVGLVTETDVLAWYRDRIGKGAAPEHEDPPVSRYAVVGVRTTTPETLASDAGALLRDIQARHLPVISDGKVVGMFADRDLRRAVGRGQLEGQRVADLMTHDVVTIGMTDRMSRAATLLSELAIGCLPVVEDGELRGLVSVVDVLASCAERFGRTSA